MLTGIKLKMLADPLTDIRNNPIHYSTGSSKKPHCIRFVITFYIPDIIPMNYENY